MLDTRRSIGTHETCVLVTLLTATVLGPGAQRAHAQNAPPDASSWTVNSQPETVFGQTEEGLGGEFSGIIDVVRAPDGTIVVAEDQLSSINFFSPDGALIATKGREGKGPGEFNRMSTLVADPEGRLLVFDEGHQRISEYTLDGEFVGDARLTRGASDRPIGGIGRFRGGSWYAWEANRVIAAGIDQVAQDTVGYYQLTDGAVGDLLGRVPGLVSTEFKFMGQAGIRGAVLSPRPLGATLGQCLLVGTSDDPVLRVLGQTGTDLGAFRLDAELEATTRDHRRQWVSTTLERRDAGFLQAMMFRGMARKIRMAEWVPFAEHLVVDDLGYIWAQQYDLSVFDGGLELQVFTETGTAVGTVTLPVAMRVIEISADSILAVRTDEYGQQDVRLYALNRGSDIVPRPLPAGCD